MTLSNVGIHRVGVITSRMMFGDLGSDRLHGTRKGKVWIWRPEVRSLTGGHVMFERDEEQEEEGWS